MLFLSGAILPLLVYLLASLPLLVGTHSHGPSASYSNEVNTLHFLSNSLVIKCYQIFLNFKISINTCVNNLNIWKFQRWKERKKQTLWFFIRCWKLEGHGLLCLSSHGTSVSGQDGLLLHLKTHNIASSVSQDWFW